VSLLAENVLEKIKRFISEISLGMKQRRKIFEKYSQTCVQRPPSGPEKSDRLTEVSDKTEIYTGR
jgi:hypothetical protein